jgi:hypothetical protein
MWWAAQPGDADLEYRVAALILIADSKPSLVRDAAIEEATFKRFTKAHNYYSSALSSAF